MLTVLPVSSASISDLQRVNVESVAIWCPLECRYLHALSCIGSSPISTASSASLALSEIVETISCSS